jgi:hypothetical protein
MKSYIFSSNLMILNRSLIKTQNLWENKYTKVYPGFGLAQHGRARWAVGPARPA